jgi:hypothetical protein
MDNVRFNLFVMTANSTSAPSRLAARTSYLGEEQAECPRGALAGREKPSLPAGARCVHARVRSAWAWLPP